MLKNKTFISKKEIKSINRKIVLHQTKILFIFGPILLIFGLAMIFIQATQEASIDWSNYLVCGCGFIFTILPFIFMILSLRSKRLDDVTYEFVFSTDDYKLKTLHNNKISKQVTVPYSKIVKIDLYKEYAYLYYSEFDGVVVKYNGFNEEEVENGKIVLAKLAKEINKEKRKRK